jgi:hypothetical protein
MKMRSMMTTVPLAAIPPRHSHAACHSVDKLFDLREALVAQAQLVELPLIQLHLFPQFLPGREVLALALALKAEL